MLNATASSLATDMRIPLTHLWSKSNICHLYLTLCHKNNYLDVGTVQVIIYDDAGYIAGVQSVLLERDVDMTVNDLTKQVKQPFLKHTLFEREKLQTVYVQDVWMGEVAWFTTAYFVDPLVICNGGRSSF